MKISNIYDTINCITYCFDLSLSIISTNISDNHYHTPQFFSKIEKKFQYLLKDKSPIIFDLIPNFKKFNKRILYFLLEKKLIKPYDSFIKQVLYNKPLTKTLSADK